MVSDIEVIIDTGGVPFSPRVHADNGVDYLDCKRTVTDLVFNKAKDWYGENLPHNIEERISKELYGDAVFNYWNEKLYVSQGYDADRTIEKTLDTGWELLRMLPRSELKRIKDEYLDKYYEAK